MITSELPIESQSTDSALSSALTPKKFQGITFEPYSLLRQMVATEICGDNAHPITAVIVHMWVCTLDRAEVMKARGNRGLALEQAFEWAQSHGVQHPDTPQLDELIDVYRQINEELYASTKVIAEKNGQEPKNVGGPLE